MAKKYNIHVKQNLRRRKKKTVAPFVTCKDGRNQTKKEKPYKDCTSKKKTFTAKKETRKIKPTEIFKTKMQFSTTLCM